MIRAPPTPWLYNPKSEASIHQESENMRLAAFLLASFAIAQTDYPDQPDYNYADEYYADYAAEYGTTARPAVGTTEAATTEAATTEAVATEAPTTEPQTTSAAETAAPELAMDAVAFETEEVEEVESAFDPRMSNPFGSARNAVTYVSNINNMDAELQANGDIMLSWDYDSTHDA